MIYFKYKLSLSIMIPYKIHIYSWTMVSLYLYIFFVQNEFEHQVLFVYLAYLLRTFAITGVNFDLEFRRTQAVWNVALVFQSAVPDMWACSCTINSDRYTHRNRKVIMLPTTATLFEFLREDISQPRSQYSRSQKEKAFQLDRTNWRPTRYYTRAPPTTKCTMCTGHRPLAGARNFAVIGLHLGATGRIWRPIKNQLVTIGRDFFDEKRWQGIGKRFWSPAHVTKS